MDPTFRTFETIRSLEYDRLDQDFEEALDADVDEDEAEDMAADRKLADC